MKKEKDISRAAAILGSKGGRVKGKFGGRELHRRAELMKRLNNLGVMRRGKQLRRMV